jgi:4-azaleucine resistance transporter AzlC
MRATLPLVIGAIPFGIIFGAVAVNSGLSAWATAAMSAFVFAGSSQFIGAGLYAGGAGILLIILTTFIVNLRHALYAASLAPHMKDLPHRWLIPLGFWLTDESYLVVIDRYSRTDSSPFKHWFFLGSAVFMYANWQICTWIGIAAGNSIPNPQQWGLEFALPLTFIGMLVPSIRTRSVLWASLSAGCAALFFSGLPNRLGLIVAILIGVGVGVVTQRFDRRSA